MMLMTMSSFVLQDGHYINDSEITNNSSSVNEANETSKYSPFSGSFFDDAFVLFNFSFNTDFINDTFMLNNDSSGYLEDISAKDNQLLPTYYSLRYRIVGTVFQSIILLVGILGNVLVIIVVKKISWMQSPTNCYLVSLALADSIVLLSSVPNEIIAYYILCDEWLWGRHACAIFVFFQYLGVNASALSITAFTVERYIAICHPMRAQTVCTIKRAKRIIWGVWTFACLYCSPWLLLTDVVDLNYKGLSNRKHCTYALDRRYYLGYYFADLVMFYLVPLMLSCILYGLMARGLVTTLRSTSKLCASSTNSTRRLNGESVRGNCKKSTSNTRVQVVKMLVVVVVLFAILWMPYRVFVVYNSFAANKYMEPWFLMFSKSMIYMNSAINPILYNALSIKFRRAFRKMLVCGPKDADGFSSSYFDSERTMVTVRFRNSRSGPSHHQLHHTVESEAIITTRASIVDNCSNTGKSIEKCIDEDVTQI
ncbi:hypothetical protein CHUAL_007847 [Chamberlinius hualienensis]